MKTIFAGGKHRKLGARSGVALSLPPVFPDIPGAIIMPDAEFDLRPSMAPIKDQGSVGDCVGEGWARILTFVLGWEVSVLFIYYFGRMLEGEGPAQDTGMMVSTGVKVCSDIGICSDMLWNYADSHERYQVAPSGQAQEEASKHKLLLAFQVPESMIPHCLAQGFPVVFAMTLHSSFESPDCLTTGRIPRPADGEEVIGGHCMVIVGRIKRDGLMYWVLANSWGAGVGDAGYFYLEVGAPIRECFTARLAS